jgi:hypothetical protein
MAKVSWFRGTEGTQKEGGLPQADRMIPIAPGAKDAFKDRFSRSQQIKISVIVNKCRPALHCHHYGSALCSLGKLPIRAQAKPESWR